MTKVELYTCDTPPSKQVFINFSIFLRLVYPLKLRSQPKSDAIDRCDSFQVDLKTFIGFGLAKLQSTKSGNHIRVFISSKHDIILLGLTIHVQFVEVSLNPKEELRRYEIILGKMAIFQLFQFIFAQQLFQVLRRVGRSKMDQNGFATAVTKIISGTPYLIHLHKNKVAHAS